MLLAAHPVLTLYAANVDETGFRDAAPPLFVALAAATVLLVAAQRLFGARPPVAIAISVIIVAFFSYGGLFNALESVALIGEHGALLPLWTSAAAGGVVLLLRTKADMARAQLLLNIVGGALVISAVIIVASTVRGPGPVTLPMPPGAETARQPKNPRDIYYLILDRYAGAPTLRETFGFDNESFLNEIRRMGFVVAQNSRGPYPNTILSLGASLNMQYVHENLARAAGEATADWRPAESLLREHKVGLFLKQHGYRYVHIGNWWDPTRRNPLADVNHNYGSLSEFSRLLLSSTAAGPIADVLGVGSDALDLRRAQYRGVIRQFERVAAAAADPRPMFVFAHFTIPHDPYVFRADGSFRPESEAIRVGDKPAYLDQVRYANAQILKILRTLTQVPLDERPVIILQSDEGPHPDVIGRVSDRFTWSDASIVQLQTKFRILNAYHLPGVETSIPGDMSPVNSFRVVLNSYFGTSFALEPTESYIFTDGDHVYRFRRVTDRLVGDG